MDPAELNGLLNSEWTYGPIMSVVDSERIGEDFGFGGKVTRLVVDTAAGSRSLIIKDETPDQVERVGAAYSLMGEALRANVPRFCGFSDTKTLFEDISPVTQGDGLDVRREQVEAMVRLLARLHATTRQNVDSGWMPSQWSGEHWHDRLDRVAERYPELMDDELRTRLTILHDEIPHAIDVLRSAKRSLIHMDSGYDNTLWREDGSIVLLDWSNARIGPPAYDLASHLLEWNPTSVLHTYRTALTEHGVDTDPVELRQQVAAGLRIVIRGMVGFAGLPDEPLQPRLLLFRDGVLPRVRQELAWLDTDPRSVGGN